MLDFSIIQYVYSLFLMFCLRAAFAIEYLDKSLWSSDIMFLSLNLMSTLRVTKFENTRVVIYVIKNGITGLTFLLDWFYLQVDINYCWARLNNLLLSMPQLAILWYLMFDNYLLWFVTFVDYTQLFKKSQGFALQRFTPTNVISLTSVLDLDNSCARMSCTMAKWILQKIHWNFVYQDHANLERNAA